MMQKLFSPKDMYIDGNDRAVWLFCKDMEMNGWMDGMNDNKYRGKSEREKERTLAFRRMLNLPIKEKKESKKRGD